MPPSAGAMAMPDAGPDGDTLAGDVDGRGDGLDESAGERFHVARVADAFGEDGEFVAAEARQHVGGPHQRPHALSHAHEQGVADGVAVTVVDGLEAVEVEAEDREAAGGSFDRALHRLAEEGPVRQAGQGVMVRQVGDAGLGRLGDRNVGANAAEAGERAVGGEQWPARQRPPPCVVAQREGDHEVTKGASFADPPTQDIARTLLVGPASEPVPLRVPLERGSMAVPSMAEAGWSRAWAKRAEGTAVSADRRRPPRASRSSGPRNPSARA